jgi:integrase/recombinase XerD
MTRERYLSDAELERFMAAVRERRHVHQPRDYALFALLANTGLRPSEARALTRADCHLEGRHPWIALHRVGKKHGPQPLARIYINRAVAAVVARYTDQLPDGLLFPFTKRQSARLFHYYADKAGISPRRKIYALRHTVGMRLWAHTQDLRLVQAILGHCNLQATEGYVHTSDQSIRAAYAAAAR